MKDNQQYKCRDKDCGKIAEEWLLVKFRNPEGKLVRKCPYCRGRVEIVKEIENERD